MRVSSHAVDQYMDRVDKKATPRRAFISLHKVYRMGHDATEYEVKSIRHEELESGTTLRLCDTCYGLIVMPMQDGVIRTVWVLESWQVWGRHLD